MEQLNKVEIRGLVGNARYTKVGSQGVMRFSVATNYAYQDKNGNPVIETFWHNVTAWENDKMPELSKIQKGTKIYVTGRLRENRYMGSDQVEKVHLEVIANRVVLIDDAEQLQYEM